MAQTKDAPSSNAFSPFYCESAVVTDVNRRTWTCQVQTKFSAKTFEDVPWGSAYTHYTGGEGFHYMPEVGATCYLASPVDNSPPFIMSFVSPPATQTAKTDDPLRSTAEPGGSSTDVSYQGSRPELNPGDMAMTGRDGNFIYLRRGGILQLGSTPMSQRICVPVRNFMHDFAENYEMATPGGDLTWLVDRPELDPAGKAPCLWSFQLREFATDKSCTVRVRHFPLADAGAKKAAWEITIAPQGIDPSTGKVTSATYTMMVLTSGAFAEMIGADRTIEVKGDDLLTIGGNQTTKVTGDSKLNAKGITLEASGTGALLGKIVKLVDLAATEPGMLGNAFIQWAQTAILQTPAGPGKFHPTSIAGLQKVLSKKMFLK
jgi:hypothetical protein